MNKNSQTPAIEIAENYKATTFTFNNHVIRLVAVEPQTILTSSSDVCPIFGLKAPKNVVKIFCQHDAIDLPIDNYPFLTIDGVSKILKHVAVLEKFNGKNQADTFLSQFHIEIEKLQTEFTCEKNTEASQEIVPAEPAIQSIFNFEDTQIRVDIDSETNEPWFNANDVCNALGYTNSRKAVLDHVDSEDDVTKRYTISTYGSNGATRKQLESYVNESGIYALIFGSKKPNAMKFKRYVTSVILPTIRKTGSYSIIQKPTEPAFKLPTNFVEALEQLLESEKQKQQLQVEVESKNLVIEAQRPAVEFTETVNNCDETFSIGDLAKIAKNLGIDTGQKRMFQTLREMGYLMKYENVPYQKYLDNQLFIVKLHTHNEKVTPTPRVTGKGIYEIITKLAQEFSKQIPMNFFKNIGRKAS